MNFSCKISNCNSQEHTNLMIRKFFQIMFIGDDLKSIVLYSATILGCGAEPDDWISDAKTNFAVDFEYFGSHENSDLQFVHTDMTDDFLKQKAHIKPIWGKEGCEVTDSQTEKIRYIKEVLYPNDISEENQRLLADNLKYLFVKEKSGEKVSRLFISLARKGGCGIDGNKVKLSVEEAGNVSRQGIEIVNWVRTEIKFDKALNPNTQMQYSIEFDASTKPFCAPDFNVYISPPSSYVIDDGAKVEYKIDNTQEHKKDLINPVDRADECYFSEWKQKHNISSRKMSRFTLKSIATLDRPIELSRITMSFGFVNRNTASTAQFFLGILLSAFIAIGADYSRTQSIIEKGLCYYCVHIIPADMQWLLACVISATVLLISTVRIPDTNEELWLKVLRWFGLGAFLLWTALIYFFQQTLPYLPCILYGSVILSGIYIFATTCMKRYKYLYPLGTFFQKTKR